jgi:hypothetical protein
MFYFKWRNDRTGEVVRVDLASSEIDKHGGALHATAIWENTDFGALCCSPNDNGQRLCQPK